MPWQLVESFNSGMPIIFRHGSLHDDLHGLESDYLVSLLISSLIARAIAVGR